MSFRYPKQTFFKNVIMKKIKITWNWPVEEGHYLVGNFFSPVAVVVILTADYEKIPEETEALVRIGVEK